MRISVISVNYHKATSLHALNSAIAFSCHNKNGNKYDEDLEMEIHPVIKVHVNWVSNLNGRMC